MVPVRVLIVDDSVVIRKLLTEALSASAEVEVAGTASSGALALAKIPQLNPDVITLDVEMPGLNGIQTLAEIRKRHPKLPVIMFSTLTERGAGVTLEALAQGASDYMTKPNNGESLASSLETVRLELIPKILALGASRKSLPPPFALAPALKRTRYLRQPVEIVAIGSSTGGPNALAQVIPRLPADFPVPVVVVQHMPPLFTRLLAERLNSQSQLSVQEATEDAVLEPGQVWIARGDYHLTIERKPTKLTLRLDQEPLENSCRPAVDVLFRSVAQTYGPGSLAVVMTGMGSDGARGALHIREAGGEILVQDEASCVVWGMPGAVVSAGAADKICPLSGISDEILYRVRFSRTKASFVSANAGI